MINNIKIKLYFYRDIKIHKKRLFEPFYFLKSGMYKRLGFTSFYTAFLQLSILLLVLYWISIQSFLLFHSIVEIAGVAILLVVFVITWNARRYIDNHYFLLIGIASLFIGAIAIVHLLAYKGMGIFPGNQADLATQLWIAGRYLTAATFLAAPFVIGKKINIPLVALVYLLAFILLFLSIFDFRNFPQTYVEGAGLTDFKKNSEYLISFTFLVAAILVYLEKKYFDRRVKRLVIFSLVAATAAEIVFTDYVSVYESANMLGHLFLISSFFLLYLGVVETALRKPSQVLYKSLRDSKDKLVAAVQEKTLELEESYASLKEAYKQLELRKELV